MNKNNKILLITNTLDIGGTERHISQIAPLLSKDFICRIFIFDKISNMGNKIKKKNLTIYSLAYSNLLKLFPKKIKLFINTIFGSLYLILVLIFYKPKIVIIYLPFAYIIAGSITTFFKVPIRIMSRRSLNYYQRKSYLFRKYEHYLHKKMHLIIPNSNSAYNNLIEEGVKKDKLHVIYNGARIVNNQTNKLNAKKQLGISKNAFVLTILANFINYKGHLKFLKALNLLKNRQKLNLKILFIGNDSGEKMNLINFLNNNLDLKNDVMFYEGYFDVNIFLKATDIGLNVSDEESFSNSILEFMSYGIPLIVNNVGDNAFLVRNNLDGLVIENNEPRSIAKTLESLILDDDIREQMSFNCLSRIKNNFLISDTAKNYKKILNQLLSKNEF